MRPRDAYRAARRRLVRSAPGRWLKRALNPRRVEVQEPPPPPRLSELFIVSEKRYENSPFMYAEWLEWAATNDPGLHERIRLSYLPAELPKDTAILHAWVQDPVRERSETVFDQLESLETSARRMGADIVHPAAVLSNSLRDTQFDALRRAGLRTPRVVDIDDGFAVGLGGLTLPVVVREAWGHCAALQRLDGPADVERWLEAHQPRPGEWVATEYIDVASADGYYRKYRYVLFGERGVCRHLIVSPNWEVRPKDRVITAETIAEELEFVNGACEAHDVLDSARRELGFDIAAFDYSFDASGEMIVWEVNPYPDLSTPRGRPGEYLAESILRTHQAFAGFYRDRLAAVT